MKNKSLVLMGLLLFAAGSLLASPQKELITKEPLEASAENISRVILSSPWYGVFDAISFDQVGSEVILSGYVVFPVTKETAGRKIKKISGVEKVTNNIDVLPLSYMDSEIRRQAYRNIFDTADLYKYVMGYSPSIHIIVKGGHITLMGVVSNKTDSRLALLAARGIPGVFSVENNLVISD